MKEMKELQPNPTPSMLKGHKWAAVALVLATGCSQALGGSASLGLVHESVTESSELVLSPELGAAPELESLAAGDSFTPIELEVEGELAIAWRRYDVQPEQRRESDVIALWRVVDRVPISASTPQQQDRPVDISAEDLGLEDLEIARDYYLVDFDNRLEFAEDFDPDLLENWEAFREAHAVCP